MYKLLVYTLLLTLIFSCTAKKEAIKNEVPEAQITIAFGSCNKYDMENLLWDDIRKAEPELWIWGGDIIYADTEDVDKISAMYNAQNRVAGYKKLKKRTQVIGTWDDHDYGLNDGGTEFISKKGSQQAFLDFMDVPADHPRRSREGIYFAHNYNGSLGRIKIIVLDTRYFRTALTEDTETEKRYRPGKYGEGTLLGEAQWKWLGNELRTSGADFNLVVSSIQFLSNEHGYECWGNFPHEVDRFKQLLLDSKAKGVIILSGDRHISEFSKIEIPGLSYPLIDFTSSGLTHAYSDFSGEPNPYRLGGVIAKESFGLIKLNMITKEVQLKIVENDGIVPLEIRQNY
ncbi:alkaline phosphatase D family protein [uncultured Eudoraea sp.]|uniref:alkaline phosphatase D family protein n=1 Tax=uncultured Eudoraea sp. TaxID=1035614 RepID=UPI0026333242|nr:alkaline phosphatase D family protein [uncultured Eudoraea sp.]